MQRLGALILTLAMAVTAACSSDSPTKPPAPTAGSILVGPTWQMVSWYDTYDLAWHDISGNAIVPIVEFSRDGTFVEDNVGGCCRQTGRWTLENGELSITYTDGSNSDVVYDVLRLDSKELQLSRFANHGPVINRYIPAQTAVDGSR